MAETTEASATTGALTTFPQRMVDGVEPAGNLVVCPANVILGLIGMLLVVDRFVGGVVPQWALFAPILVWYAFHIPPGSGALVRG